MCVRDRQTDRQTERERKYLRFRLLVKVSALFYAAAALTVHFMRFFPFEINAVIFGHSSGFIDHLISQASSVTTRLLSFFVAKAALE